MRGRALMVIVLLAAASQNAATAAPQRSVLRGVTTILGEAGTVMAVRLPEQTTVRTPFGDSPDLRIQTSSEFVGLALVGTSTDTTGTVLFGGRIPSGDQGTTFLAPLPDYPFPGGGNYDFAKTYKDETTLPAGDYDLYLIADSPSRIELRLRTLEGRTTVRPSSPASYRIAQPPPTLLGANGTSSNLYSAADNWTLKNDGLLFHALWLKTDMHVAGQYFLCHRPGPAPLQSIDSGPGCPLADKAIANDRYTMLEPDTKLLFQGYAGVGGGEHGLGVWYSSESVIEDFAYMTLWLPYSP